MRGTIVSIQVGLPRVYQSRVGDQHQHPAWTTAIFKEPVEGPVAAKPMQDDRLLLTIVTPSGAILGTFKKKIEEINLLVETGDTVALTIPGYQPFLEDPEITRVAKPMGETLGQSPEPPAMDAMPDSAAEADSLQTLEEGDTLKSEQASRWY